MNDFTLSIQMSGEWGRCVRIIVITIVILVLTSLGMEIHLPFVL